MKNLLLILSILLMTSCSWTVTKKTVFTVVERNLTEDYLFGKYKKLAKYQYIIYGSTLDPDITLYSDSLFNRGDTLIFVKKHYKP